MPARNWKLSFSRKAPKAQSTWTLKVSSWEAENSWVITEMRSLRSELMLRPSLVP